MQKAKTSYNVVTYQSYPRPESHPSRLAVISSLFGLEHVPLHECRVLEIGCGSGGNLIPLAASFPNGHFVGFDLSSAAVEEGGRLVSALGLKNIELSCRDVAEKGFSGEFDYIICHGVFSWVSREIQENILKVCSTNLGPKGLVFISYNTLPGWHMWGALREMLLFHAGHFTDPAEKLEQARALLEFLVIKGAESSDPYDVFLRERAEELRRARPDYIFHEYLEEENHPVYFHEFADRIRKFDLQYVGDSDFVMMGNSDFPPETRKVLSELSGDRIKSEQYCDFLRNRRFRQSILCCAGRKVLSQPSSAGITAMYISSAARPEKEVALNEEASVKFQLPGGGEISTAHPLTRAALTILGRSWPARIHFPLLAKAASTMIGKEGEVSAGEYSLLAENLFACYGGNLIELNVDDALFTTEISEKPCASPLARHQAERGREVTTLRHRALKLEPITLRVLSILDGTRTREDVLTELVRLAYKGEMVIESSGKRLSTESELKNELSPVLDRILTELAKQALLLKNS